MKLFFKTKKKEEEEEKWPVGRTPAYEGCLLFVPEVASATASLGLVGRHAAADCALNVQGKEMAATFLLPLSGGD